MKTFGVGRGGGRPSKNLPDIQFDHHAKSTYCFSYRCAHLGDPKKCYGRWNPALRILGWGRG